MVQNKKGEERTNKRLGSEGGRGLVSFVFLYSKQRGMDASYTCTIEQIFIEVNRAGTMKGESYTVRNTHAIHTHIHRYRIKRSWGDEVGDMMYRGRDMGR